VRKLRIEAPRGDIVDRSGEAVLVKTREAPVVQIEPDALPESEREIAAKYGEATSAAERDRLAAVARLEELERTRKREGREDRRLTAEERRERRILQRRAARARKVEIPPMPDDPEVTGLFERLGRVIDMSPERIHRRVVQQVAQTPYAAVTVKTDISRAAYNYLEERAKDFPGIRAETQYLREYPYDDLGAHLFGTLREISPEELEDPKYRGVDPGTRIGKDGVEETYDNYLRGQPGYERQVVDALGNPCRTCPQPQRTKPEQGRRVRLTLDFGLQRQAQKAVERAIRAAASNGSQAGAFVAMNPDNGEIYALGSVPSFDANLFAKPLSQEKFDQLNSDATGKPLYNRAIAGVYPTGSTFKLVTATAALESGALGAGETIFDDGLFELGPQKFKNAKDAKFGLLDLSGAMKVSSDVFFYTLGNRMYDMEGQVLQTWARRLGVGRRTGIDIPGEFAGLVPDRKWRDEGYKRYQACVKRNKLQEQTIAALNECGGIERPYAPGDNVNLSVGQGDLQATPLQMAVAYSTLANGGKVVQPHLGKRVETGNGELIQELRFPPRKRVQIGEQTRNVILDGLRRAAMEPGGTSYEVMKGFGGGKYTIYGKTGTVERIYQPDQSWYVAYVPHETRPIVVVVTIEKGGFGAETAAPAARLILSEWFGLGEDQFRAGSSDD
jgi:penicillin-binding protein 2